MSKNNHESWKVRMVRTKYVLNVLERAQKRNPHEARTLCSLGPGQFFLCAYCVTEPAPVFLCKSCVECQKVREAGRNLDLLLITNVRFKYLYNPLR